MSIRNVPFSPPDITEYEIREVISALKSGWITTGPRTKELEKKIASYIGLNKAVCLNSATAAMEGVLRILGIGPGDEVITTAYTYSASASIIHHVGAKIILVDTAPNSWEMDYEKLDSLINENTKMIIPVDLAGVICDYDRIFKIVEKHKSVFKTKNQYHQIIGRVAIMSDAAHAFGAMKFNKHCGQFADFTCFSFHAVKNLTTAEGGAVVWRNDLNLDDDNIYKEFMLYSLHGQSKDALSKSQIGAWEYDIVYPAYKCNMTDVLASLGLVQLNRYNDILSKRKKLIQTYDDILNNAGIESLQHFGDDYSSSGHLYLSRLPNINESERNSIISLMAEKGISTNVHYKPLPMFTAYRNLGFDIVDFPNAFNMYKNQITLPLNTCITEDDVVYVAETLVEIYKKIKDK